MWDWSEELESSESYDYLSISGWEPGENSKQQVTITVSLYIIFNLFDHLDIKLYTAKICIISPLAGFFSHYLPVDD